MLELESIAAFSAITEAGSITSRWWLPSSGLCLVGR